VSVTHSAASRPEFRAHADEKFPVRWAGASFPSPTSGCTTGNASSSLGLCTVDTNSVTLMSTCMCQANIVVSAVFNSSTDATLPTAAEVVERLRIGSSPPERFDTGTYARCVTAACNAAAPAVVVYLPSASATGFFDAATIFQITVNGTSTYLANKESHIVLGDFSFRKCVLMSTHAARAVPACACCGLARATS
jgi:hypothetical protein